MTTLLSSKIQGDLIKLDGIDFYVVAHEAQGTKVIRKDVLSDQVAYRSDNQIFYSLDRDLGLYLKQNYWNTLSDNVKKMVVQNANWYVGPPNEENTRVVTSPVGLLTRIEWMQYSTYYGGKIPPTPLKISWLLTPYDDYPYVGNYAYTMYYDGRVMDTGTSNLLNVRPVLILKSTLLVLDDGSITDNRPPTNATIPNQSTQLGINKAVNLSSYFSDADGDILTYTVSSSNTNIATVSIGGATLTIVPKSLGSATITVTANDGKGGTQSTTFTFSVVNSAPNATTIPTQSTRKGSNLTVNLANYFSDVDGQTLNYSVSSSNTSIATTSVLGSTLTINGVAVGSTTITVIANDGQATTSQTFTVNVVNSAPTVSVTEPIANQTLYENGTFAINGTASDTDNGNAVTIKYQIDSGAVRNLASGISDGVNPINFTKNLTYSEGVLKDGTTVLTSVLSKHTPHTLSIWAEDDQGGKSSILTRTFYVVPNRPPTLTIDPITAQSDLINSNTITVSGSAGDADNNNVTVTFKINDGEAQQVYTGPPSNWTFNVMLKDLNSGANTLKIEVTDSYNVKVSKVLTINKTHDAVPVNQASALYKITPPTGSASRILLWIERLLGDLAIATEVSMTNAGEPENFVPLTRTNTAPIDTNTQEDEFAYDAGAAKTNIILKVTYSRSDAKSVQTIKKLSGVLS